MEKKKLYLGGLALAAGAMIANVINLTFNLYLGKSLSVIDFGELTFYTSLLYIVSIPLGSFSETIGHTMAKLYGKYNIRYAKGYSNFILQKTIRYGLISTFIWVIATPFLTDFFKSHTPFLVLSFAPIWLIYVLSANYSGYLKGTIAFEKISARSVAEALSRFLIAFTIIYVGIPQYAFMAIPVSLSIETALGWTFARRVKSEEIQQEDKKFNKNFFLNSLISGIPVITFLSLDVLLVKHYLSPVEAGQYGLMSLIGKMTFFFGSLLAPLMIPLVSHNQGANKGSKNTFVFLFAATAFFSFGSLAGLGLLGNYILPLVFKEKALAILPLMPTYVFAMAVFTTTQPIVSFLQAKEKYVFAKVGLLVSALQVLLVGMFHENVTQVVWVMVVVSLFNLFSMVLLFGFEQKNRIIRLFNRRVAH